MSLVDTALQSRPFFA